MSIVFRVWAMALLPMVASAAIDSAFCKQHFPQMTRNMDVADVMYFSENLFDFRESLGTGSEHPVPQCFRVLKIFSGNDTVIRGELLKRFEILSGDSTSFDISYFRASRSIPEWGVYLSYDLRDVKVLASYPIVSVDDWLKKKNAYRKAVFNSNEGQCEYIRAFVDFEIHDSRGLYRNSKIAYRSFRTIHYNSELGEWSGEPEYLKNITIGAMRCYPKDHPSVTKLWNLSRRFYSGSEYKEFWDDIVSFREKVSTRPDWYYGDSAVIKSK